MIIFATSLNCNYQLCPHYLNQNLAVGVIIYEPLRVRVVLIQFKSRQSPWKILFERSELVFQGDVISDLYCIRTTRTLKSE